MVLLYGAGVLAVAIVAIVLVGMLIRSKRGDDPLINFTVTITEGPPASAADVGGHQGQLHVVVADNIDRVVALKYMDSEGVVSSRDVTVRQAVAGEPGGPITHLVGFCHTRRAARTFRRDRILSMADGTTGEIIEDLDAAILGHAAPSPILTAPQPAKARRSPRRQHPATTPADPADSDLPPTKPRRTRKRKQLPPDSPTIQ